MKTETERGLYVCIVGPDGTGKSTLAASLSEVLGDRVVHRYWRPGFLPMPRQLVGRPPDGLINSDPHGVQSNGQLKATARTLYYFADFVLGYWLRCRPLLLRGRHFVLERGWQDLEVDPRRYQLRDARLVRRLTRFVPRPDLHVILHVPAEVAAERKPELPIGEIERQLDLWPKLARSRRRTVVLDASQAPDDLRGDLVALLASGYAGKLVSIGRPA
jgi:thymidylate kinase